MAESRMEVAVNSWRAKGRKKEQGLNKLEQAYQDELDRRIAAGEYLWRSVHGAVNLRLADKCFYRPDYFVLNAAMELEVHEVKGGWFPSDNKARTKIAAEIYPFRFLLITRPRVKDPWQYEEL